MLDENPVFAEQGDDVRDGSKSHVIKDFLEFGHVPAEVVFASVFQEGVSELECNADSGEIVHIREFGVNLRIDVRNRFRKRVAGFVVVGDDHVDSAPRGVFHGFAAVDAAVDGHEDAAGSACALERFRKGFGREAVSVVETVREKIRHNRAVAFQNPGEERRGCDAVGVIISVNEDVLAVDDRLPEAFDGCLHSGKAEGVA